MLRFLWISNQNYWPISGIRHIFSVQLYTGSLSLFILFFKPQYWYVCKFLEEADCQHADDKQSKQAIRTKHSLDDFYVTRSVAETWRQKSISSKWKANFTIFMDKQPKLLTNRRDKAYFQRTILLLFILFFKPQYWYVCKFLEEAHSQHADDRFWLFYRLST